MKIRKNALQTLNKKIKAIMSWEREKVCYSALGVIKVCQDCLRQSPFVSKVIELSRLN